MLKCQSAGPDSAWAWFSICDLNQQVSSMAFSFTYSPPAAPAVAYQRHRHCRQHRHSFLLFSFGPDCLLIVAVAVAADVAFVERLLGISFCHSEHPPNSPLYSPSAGEQCTVNCLGCSTSKGFMRVSYSEKLLKCIQLTRVLKTP